MEKHQIVVLGNGAVGKSAFVIRTIGKGFVERYDPTIEDVYTKVVVINGKEESFEIVDSAGQEDFANIREQYIQKADGFLLVCSITDEDSFKDIESVYLKQIYRVRDLTAGTGFPIVIVLNKSDLSEQRKVSTERLEELGKAHSVPVFEASAKTCVNVQEAFSQLSTLVVEGKRQANAAAAAAKEAASAGGAAAATTTANPKKKWWKW